MNKIKAGILGGAGYTGGELIRVLLNHPDVELNFIHSRSHAGEFIYQVHSDLLGDTELQFTDLISREVDLIFLCLGHGESEKIISEINEQVRIIDLSQDFRTKNHSERNFIYGLPELHKEKIKTANNIANPGCFATAIQLALLPLANQNLLPSQIHISSTTGSTGAGQSLTESSHFSWRENNLSVYKPFTHQHLAEIRQSLTHLQKEFSGSLNMFPQRGAFTRGILACINLKTDQSPETLIELYSSFYSEHPFVHLSKKNIHLKQVVNTNKCIIYLEKHEDELMIVSVLDNLLKGASGQAVQNMNLMFGFKENSGLNLKASAF